jgi:ubiquinone/menaquinone biosynthesis C-methylase UbiE
MIGTRDRPYTLRWPAPTYERKGAEMGFDFSESELEQARRSDGVLGVRRYLPSASVGDAESLPLPAGTFVSCRLQEV